MTGPATAEGLPVSLTDPGTGKRVQLAPGDRALHIVFFGTWCPPCVDELDSLAELEARWGERGYRLVLVAVQNRHDRDKLNRYLANRNPPGRLLFDADGSAERNLRGTQLPTHLLFDANGREQVRSGALNDEVAEAIEQLLQPRRGGSEETP